MDQLLPSVAECDTIFAASSSEHVLLSKTDVRPRSPWIRVEPAAPRLMPCMTGTVDRSLQSHGGATKSMGCDMGGETLIEYEIADVQVEPMPPASAAVGGVRRFFDIAVPRNISSDVNDCGASAHVYNVDDLKEVRRSCFPSQSRLCVPAEQALACGRWLGSGFDPPALWCTPCHCARTGRVKNSAALLASRHRQLWRVVVCCGQSS